MSRCMIWWGGVDRCGLYVSGVGIVGSSCPCPSGWKFFFSSRRRHTRFDCDWSSDVCSSDLTRQQSLDALLRPLPLLEGLEQREDDSLVRGVAGEAEAEDREHRLDLGCGEDDFLSVGDDARDRKSVV